MENTGELDDSVSELKSLLQQVQAIKAKNDAVIEATGGNYNLFRELGIGHDELIFSKMIASLLKINVGNLKEIYVKSFIEKIGFAEELEKLQPDYKNAKVNTEYRIGEKSDKTEIWGRIDLILDIPILQRKHFAFIIENKIWANDQPKQLIRYKKYGDSYYSDGTEKRYRLLYLTLDGKEASADSVCIGDEKLQIETENPDYFCIAYGNEILDWLEDCEKEAYRFPLVKEAIHHFSNRIKRLTGQDMNNNEEIIELLKKGNNIELSDIIKNGNLLNKAKKTNIREYLLHGELERFAEEHDLIFSYDQSHGKKVYKEDEIPCMDDVQLRLNFKNPSSDKIYICFESTQKEHKSFDVGIRFKDGRIDIYTKEQVDYFYATAAQKLSKQWTSNWWVWRKTLGRLSFSEDALKKNESSGELGKTLKTIEDEVETLLPVLNEILEKV